MLNFLDFEEEHPFEARGYSSYLPYYITCPKTTYPTEYLVVYSACYIPGIEPRGLLLVISLPE